MRRWTRKLPLTAVPAYARRVEQARIRRPTTSPRQSTTPWRCALLALEHTTRIIVRYSRDAGVRAQPDPGGLHGVGPVGPCRAAGSELGLGTQIKQNIRGSLRHAVDRTAVTDDGIRRRRWTRSFGAFRTGGLAALRGRASIE